MPLQATSGAASYDAFGGGVPVEPNYIESVFSCFLYTGNGSTQTITNGIDLAGKGGLVWMKNRTTAGDHHVLTDTVTGATKQLASNLTDQQYTYPGFGLTSFGATGFTVTDNSSGSYYVNGSAKNYVGWTFRKQPKFFDVVTYTGTGSNTGNNIAHSLGSLPGFLIFKATSTTSDWCCLAQNSSGNYEVLQLNTTASSFGAYSPTTSQVTTTTFNPGRIWGNSANASGQTYVAYLFASNAGGFGLTGTDNVISCGSFTTDGSGNATVSLGYEPQWILYKTSNTTSQWVLRDTMRGWPAAPSSSRNLFANLSSEEQAGGGLSPNATGFQAAGIGATNTFIYIAIRRGPMKVPTDGTKVFAPLLANNTTGTKNTTTFPVDLQIARYQGVGSDNYTVDRLRGLITTPTTGDTPFLRTQSTAAEANDAVTRYMDNTGFQTSLLFDTAQGGPVIYWNFRRAPGFFDEVCYSGVNAVQNVSHNLGVAPELMIVKRRNSAASWFAYAATLGATRYLILSSTAASDTSTLYWNDTEPTSSVFTLANNSGVNAVNNTYVAYLFATCAGVSKVGSYTGTGTTQQINCGFIAGSRFVLIKRTDSTGDWYVWDSARGIVAGNDPYLLLNSTAAEVTSTDYVDTYSAGFEITSTAPAAINASGGTFIFLAIA